MKRLSLLLLLTATTLMAQKGQEKEKPTSGISKGEATQLYGVFATLPNFEYDAKFTVKSYDFVLARKNGDIFSESNQGELFNEKIKALIQTCRAGDVLYFENIKAVGPDKLVRHLGQIVERVY